MGYYMDAELFYGIKVHSELEEPMFEYGNGMVSGYGTGCRMTGRHIAEWLAIRSSHREILDGEVTEAIIISELKTNPEWDDLLLHYAQQLGVQALTSPGWIVASSGG